MITAVSVIVLSAHLGRRGPSPATACGADLDSCAHLGRRGPSPATACGAHCVSPRPRRRLARADPRPGANEAQAEEHRRLPLPGNRDERGGEPSPCLRPVAARVRFLAEPVVRVGDDAPPYGPEPFHRRRTSPAELVENTEAIAVHPRSI